ncbi:hypothetical protein [Myxococcus stipitatus]|uniref:hypothetical protein n=1 Tax=Myxococcus stipitatus TaxID=83455 RepID=UPI0030D4E86E
MVKDPRRQPAPQPLEDYYGRAPTVEDEEEVEEVTESPSEDDDASWHAHPMDPTERTPRAILDDIPDGDGPRSDAGTNPLPDLYWTAFPGSLEEEKD